MILLLSTSTLTTVGVLVVLGAGTAGDGTILSLTHGGAEAIGMALVQAGAGEDLVGESAGAGDGIAGAGIVGDGTDGDTTTRIGAEEDSLTTTETIFMEDAQDITPPLIEEVLPLLGEDMR